MDIKVKKVQKVWKSHSYVVYPFGDSSSRRMAVLGFFQALEELGIKIVEERSKKSASKP